MKDVIEPKPLLISIAKCLVADVTSPIVSFIPIPRDFLASITAKAVRITKKLLAKTLPRLTLIKSPIAGV